MLFSHHNHREIDFTGHLDHSTYCDHVVSDLILPVVEAAVILPSPEQKNFTYLMTTVFFNEYRKIITSNKKVYKYVITVSISIPLLLVMFAVTLLVGSC